ncbi:hypothetical protein GCM10007874_72890 [Labrys miyagiensis]|uniref:Glutamine amidotransferase type-2 domain-containing protein n=1 Tax=Labrys miyagiensis TaxID=346912 RepID=A0ABQ6CVD7_9HYPH|nr:hypothetical protein GCM10007874_72890 [Labrys miyagiensis]
MCGILCLETDTDGWADSIRRGLGGRNIGKSTARTEPDHHWPMIVTVPDRLLPCLREGFEKTGQIDAWRIR